MLLEISFKSEGFFAARALERLVVDVNVVVDHEILTSGEDFAASVSVLILKETFVLRHISVCFRISTFDSHHLWLLGFLRTHFSYLTTATYRSIS